MIDFSVKGEDRDKIFMHFKESSICRDFKTWYQGPIGHTCCNGKGCLLPNLKNNKDMYELKKTFLEQYLKNNK